MPSATPPRPGTPPDAPGRLPWPPLPSGGSREARGGRRRPREAVGGVRGRPGGVGAVAGIIHEIHWFSLICIDFHCFALILHGLGMDPGTFLRMPCDVDSHALALHIDF